MVASGGADCLDARALMGVSIVPSIACAKHKNTPVHHKPKYGDTLTILLLCFMFTVLSPCLRSNHV